MNWIDVASIITIAFYGGTLLWGVLTCERLGLPTMGIHSMKSASAKTTPSTKAS